MNVTQIYQKHTGQRKVAIPKMATVTNTNLLIFHITFRIT